MKMAFVSAVPITSTSFISPCSFCSNVLRNNHVTSPSNSRVIVPSAIFEINSKDISENIRSKLPNLPTLKSVLEASTKSLAVAAIACALIVAIPDASEAARSGGRVGGSSFRSAPAPSQRVAPPSSSYGGGYYGGGYGYGFGGPSLFMNPFIAVPFGGFGLGFGGLGTLFVVSAVLSILSSKINTSEGDNEVENFASSRNAMINLKLGLLSNARSLQIDLDMLTRSADTTTPSGLNYVLQNAIISLLRNPDYWAYASCTTSSVKQADIESEYNKIVLEERLKLEEETLINSAGNTYISDVANVKEQDLSQAPAEYIVVNIIAAVADGKLVTAMPKVVDGVPDVERALKGLSGVTKDTIQAVEIIWAPQSQRDTLTKQEMLQDHPELKAL